MSVASPVLQAPAPRPSWPPSLAGQAVVVVGGSSGIGLAAARLARALGASLLLVARNEDRLRQAAAETGADIAVADLADAEALARAVGQAARIDHLIVTAGSVDLKPLAASQPDELRAVVAERLAAPLIAIRAALPVLAPTGSIVLTSGQAASRPFASGAALVGGVAGVEAMTRSLAQELAPIRVNAVSPGLTDTPLLDTLFGDRKGSLIEGMTAKLPIGRAGTAEEVAHAMLFLMTNTYVTGEVVHVDGGGRWV